MTYPVSMIAQMAGLTDLLQKPMPDEIDERGCLSKGVCKIVDVTMLKWAGKQLAGFYMPAEVGHGTNPLNRWRTASCLQKSIRAGDAEMAMFAVSALWDMDSTYARKRLGVIAVEDVMMGNLPIVMTTLAMMGDMAWRKSVDERRLLIWLARELASGVKDRSTVSLLVSVGLLPDEKRAKLGKMTNEELEYVLWKSGTSWQVQQAAACAMAGTKRYEAPGMSEENDRPPTALFKLMVDDGMCRALLFVAARTCSRVQDTMFTTMLVIDRWLRGSPMDIIPLNVGARPMIGKLLGASYDRYTREGQAAIARFFSVCPALKPFMEATPPAQRREMTYRAVFLSEGGLLDRRAVYGHSEAIRDMVHDPIQRFPWMHPELALTVFPTVQKNLVLLNECRKQVLQASLSKK